MHSFGGGSGTVLCIGDEAVRLNLRCSFLKQHGWQVLSSGSAHEGVIRFSSEKVDAAIIDFGGDGAEAALIAGEMKRLHPKVPVIMLVPEDNVLPDDTVQCADVLVPCSDEPCLLRALESFRRDSGNA
jgi:DNA-binding response OmpR family regulator